MLVKHQGLQLACGPSGLSCKSCKGLLDALSVAQSDIAYGNLLMAQGLSSISSRDATSRGGLKLLLCCGIVQLSLMGSWPASTAISASQVVPYRHPRGRQCAAPQSCCGNLASLTSTAVTYLCSHFMS